MGYNCKTNKFSDQLICIFFNHQLKLKMFHFQTTKYSCHKSIDKYLKEYRKKIDKFMESYQGIYGKLETAQIDIKFDTLNDSNIFEELDAFSSILETFDKHFSNTGLLSIRDELLTNVNQLKYLFTFN